VQLSGGRAFPWNVPHPGFHPQHKKFLKRIEFRRQNVDSGLRVKKARLSIEIY
jgi:hypothetical protein